MKLIVSGGSGLIATELIRQSLLAPKITSLVVLTRRPIAVPDSREAVKLKQVIVDDYGTYSDEAKNQLRGADACIWTVAITPSKSKQYPFEEVRRICQTCTMAGLKAIVEAGQSDPFRFLYVSGWGAHEERLGQWPAMAEYLKMRLETGEMVKKFLDEQPGENHTCVARSGLVTSNVTAARSVWGFLLRSTNLMPNLSVQEVSAALLYGVIHGFEGNSMEHEDLVRIGKKALQEDPSG